MLKLFVDSDSDVVPSELKELDIKMISMPYIIDGVTYFPFKDSDEFDYKAFYNSLRKGVMPSTCALSPLDYINYFEPVFKNGDDIIYVHFSTAMTGTFNAMNIALQELKEKYPERKFWEVDLKGITINAYIQVLEAIDLYKAGKSGPEMVEALEAEVDHWATYFYASDLRFFARSGRVSNFKAIMGTIIGLHPILNMAATGMMGSVDKARGRKGTLLKIVDYMKKLGDDVQGHRIVIGHSDAMDEVNELIGYIKKEYGDNLDIKIVNVNPTAGSHCGPGNVGVAFHAKQR